MLTLKFNRFLVEEYGACVNEQDLQGMTPLHFACLSNSIDLVVFYLTKGAKMVLDRGGNSALHCCASSGTIECARALVSQSFEVSLKNGEGRSCVDLALEKGHLKFAKEFQRFLSLVGVFFVHGYRYLFRQIGLPFTF